MKKETNDKKVAYQINNMLYKDNTLIDAKYKASLVELKLTFLLQEKLQQGLYRDEEDGLYVDMNTNELVHGMCKDGKIGGSLYKNLKTVSRKMIASCIGIEDDEQEMFSYINMIIQAEFKNGTLTVVFNKKWKKYLIDLKENFTKLPRNIMLDWDSIYSYRLYEILKKRCFYPKNYNGPKNGWFIIEKGLSELKLNLGVVDSTEDSVQQELSKAQYGIPDYDKAVSMASSQSYKTWGNFRNRCILPSISEINTKSDIQVNFTPQKKNRGGMVYAINFSVYVKALDEIGQGDADIEHSPSACTSDDGTATMELDQNKKFPIWVEVLEIFKKENLNLSDIQAICDVAGYDIEKIRKAKETLDNQHCDIENVTGWLIACIRNNFTTNKKNSNLWNNFTQNQYDFETLENEILSN